MKTWVQTKFVNGCVVKGNAILTTKDVVVACYVLVNLQEGDTLRTITEKLPSWIKYKNDIKGILGKLEKLKIITMRNSIKGKRVNEISEKAEEIAVDLIKYLEKSRLLLNDLDNDTSPL
ncbi:MAG: hypothetical protein KAT65_04360 [Methanophagales archaeon]|nr:hypothetical protein [Methanophagales archaeon]